MNVVAQVFAVLAGLLHVSVFVMESLLFRRPAVQRIFVGHTRVDEGVHLWAFNQGFYNLFLAIGAIGGVVAYQAGSATVGPAIALYACGFMVACGAVLVVSERRLWRGALAQAVPPLIALAASLA